MEMPSARRKTKIISTLGPKSSSENQIRELLTAGTDVVRLNFSHGDHESHGKLINIVRRLAAELNRPVGILQDLGGPKIRLGRLRQDPLELTAGSVISLVPGEAQVSDFIPVNYPYLLDDVSRGERILLADGRVELVVENKKSDRLDCRVIVGGVVTSRKGVNLPLSKLRIPAFTDKDRDDLRFGLQHDVDFVALSFVRHEKDVEPVRTILQTRERPPLLIAKIEKPQAVERLEQILLHVDGLMVARGDLGVEMPLERVPLIQKRIIRTTRQAGKPVITATQMLGSMVANPRPSRAEATDVANAILDGTDALMLSEETAMGAYPAEAVRTLHRIALATEPVLADARFANETPSPLLATTAAAISHAACTLAQRLQAVAIVASTASGSTARLVSRLRPSCPIVALTPHYHTRQQLTLSSGVIPVLTRSFETTDEMFELAGQWAKGEKIGKPGDRIVVTAGIPVGVVGTTNLIKVMEIR